MKFTSVDHLQDYLLKAALGHVPIPISKENLEKAYAHFKGADTKSVILKITSRLDILFNLVPATKEISPELTEDTLQTIHNFIEENALHESAFKFNTSHEVRQTLLELRDEQYHMLSKVFRNPDQVAEALYSTTKREWMERLQQEPTTTLLLSASAGLSSEDFFHRQMHLAFMEIEPNIYGPFHPEYAHLCFNVHRLFRREQQLKKLAEHLELQEKQKPKPPVQQETRPQKEPSAPSEEPKPEKKELDSHLPRQPKAVYTPPTNDVPKDAPSHSKSHKSHPKAEKKRTEDPKRPAPVKLPEAPKPSKEEPKITTHTPKHKLSTNLQDVDGIDLEKALSKEIGSAINLSNSQKEELISSAKKLIFNTNHPSGSPIEDQAPANFLHKENPLPIKEKLTLETISLATKKPKTS